MDHDVYICRYCGDVEVQHATTVCMTCGACTWELVCLPLPNTLRPGSLVEQRYMRAITRVAVRYNPVVKLAQRTGNAHNN